MDEKEDKKWPLVRAKIGCSLGKSAVQRDMLGHPSGYTIYLLFDVLEDIVYYLEQKESKNG